MYVMRLLSHADRPRIDALLTARTLWDQQHQRPHHGQNPALLSQLADSHQSAQVIGMEEDGQLVGMLTLMVREPGLVGWTAAERQEEALSVTTAIAHPAQHDQRLARIASLWLADYIARLPGPPIWVRSAVRESRLALYLKDVCGWQLVRGARDPDGHRSYRLQLRAQIRPGLPHLVASDAELAAPLADLESVSVSDAPARPDLLPR
ncbi:hypothetical protein ACFWXK_24375 [Streptomyces sp. NPDC059070]|uniref:hypothetical protein n=1 Tax=Streptomyces sp. NPDC059070 TaxID=3346713 RepID=UPI0036BEF322